MCLGRGRVEKTEIVEMAIKYINHLRDNTKSNFNSTETFKNLSFGDQSVDNSLSKLNNFSSINLFKDESNASLQNSLQNSLNQNLNNLNKQFNDTSNDDYLNGFRDCYTEVIQFLTTNEAKLSQISLHQPALKDRLNEQLIIDLRNYLDNFLKKQQQFNQLNSKRRVDFSDTTKLFNNNNQNTLQSVDGLQIKLEEMDVEESSNRLKNKNLNDKLNFEDKFPKLTFNNCCTNNLSKSLANNNNSTPNNTNLNSNIDTANFNKTLKNYLTNNELLKTDYLKNNFNNSNLDLNPTIKSRSLTSSPNSSNLDAAYKFKSSIKEKFDAEFNSKLNRLDDNKMAMSRPRSATVGANTASIDKIRRLNTALELKEKIINSNTELNADRLESIDNNRLNNNKNNLNNSLHNQQQLKLNLIKKPTPGFILHPNQSYYIPVEIDLNNLTQQIKSNLINHNELLNLENLHNLTNLHQKNSSKTQQLNHQINLHQLNQNAFLNTNFSQNSLNQFQDHLSFSSPSLNSLNSINNSSIPNCLNQTIKCCLDDKFANENSEPILYPISISVNFKFPPLSLNASVLNSQKSLNLF